MSDSLATTKPSPEVLYVSVEPLPVIPQNVETQRVGPGLEELPTAE